MLSRLLTVATVLLLCGTPQLARGAELNIVKVVAGDPQSCALASSGDLYCWAVARTTEPHFAPGAQRVTGLPPLKDLDIGMQALSCGIDMQGAVVCWQPIFEDAGGEYRPNHTFAPTIDSGHVFTAVAVGFSHMCALEQNGALWCVGDNAAGELGTGDTKGRGDLRRVVGLPPVAAFDTGVNNTCAVTRQGEAWCWGTDSPIVNRPMIVNSKVPVQVKGPRSLLRIQDGRNSMCATSSQPSVYCWGDNIMAQLGVPDSDMKGRLFAVLNQPLDQPVISISSGAFNTCILLQDGAVRCWGTWGTIADPRKIYVPEVKHLPAPAAAVSVSAANDKACALLGDGSIWCWGYRRTAADKAPDYVEEPWQVPLPKK